MLKVTWTLVTSLNVKPERPAVRGTRILTPVIRNFVNNEIKRAKRAYINKELQDNASNPDKFWKIIKEIFPTKIKSNKTASSFKLDHKEIKRTSQRNSVKIFSSVAIQLKRKTFFFKNFVWGYRSSHERYSSLLNFTVLKYPSRKHQSIYGSP